MAFSPRAPAPRPAVDAVTITRDGYSIDAFFCSSGANLLPAVSVVLLVKTTQPSTWQWRGEQHAQADSIEDTFDVQIHHLRESAVRMGIELLSPGSSRVCEQNVHVVRRLHDLLHQCLYICKLCAVGGH